MTLKVGEIFEEKLNGTIFKYEVLEYLGEVFGLETYKFRNIETGFIFSRTLANDKTIKVNL